MQHVRTCYGDKHGTTIVDKDNFFLSVFWLPKAFDAFLVQNKRLLCYMIPRGRLKLKQLSTSINHLDHHVHSIGAKGGFCAFNTCKKKIWRLARLIPLNPPIKIPYVAGGSPLCSDQLAHCKPHHLISDADCRARCSDRSSSS